MEGELKRVDTIARMRRAFHVQGWTMKRIARELHVSRNTVRKILRSDETDFRYEREHQPMARIGPWQAEVDRFLTANEGKPSRERLTLIRIYEEVRALGFEGSYDAIRRYAKMWSKARGSAVAEAYVPLHYAPGEAYQFDWSHEVVLIGGVTTTVKVAHVRLCHSRMMFARAYMRESQEMVFDAHDRAFAFFKGTCTRGIYDSEAWPPWVRGQAEQRRRSRRSSSARSGSTTGASFRCATIWSSRLPASRRPVGRKARSRTRLA
jgi:transposase